MKGVYCYNWMLSYMAQVSRSPEITGELRYDFMTSDILELYRLQSVEI